MISKILIIGGVATLVVLALGLFGGINLPDLFLRMFGL